MRTGISKQDFDAIPLDIIDLLFSALREVDEAEAKRHEYRAADLYSVIASVMSGKSVPPSSFLNDPEKEQQDDDAKKAYEEILAKSQGMNGPNDSTGKS